MSLQQQLIAYMNYTSKVLQDLSTKIDRLDGTLQLVLAREEAIAKELRELKGSVDNLKVKGLPEDKVESLKRHIK